MEEHALSRRSFLRTTGLVTGAAAFGLPLAACTGSGGGSDSSGTFSFMSWDTTSGTPVYDVAEDWAKSVGRKIDVQSVPSDDYDTKLRTVLSSGVGPDAIRINDDYVKGYYAEGSLLDLRKYIKRDKINAADYFPVAYNFPVQEDGAHAAWPIGTNPGVIYINVDAFKEAGVPLPPTGWSDDGWKWADFLSAAEKLTKPNGERWGCLVFPDTSLETVWPVNNGTSGIYSPDGKKFTLADKGSTDAIQWVADLSLKHKVHPPFSTVSAGANTPNWALDQFGTGKVAMLLSLISGIPYLRENAKVHWDIVAPPGQKQQKTVNTMTVLAIPKISKDPDNAWKFLKYYVDDKSAKALAQSRGFMPVRRSAAKYFVSDGKDPKNLALVPVALDHAVNENFSKYIQQARTVYRPVLDDVYSGKRTAAQALGSVRDKVNQVLAGKGQ
jgi:multiple sugar transport system substrate-binding protein